MSGGHAVAASAVSFDTTIPSIRRIHHLIKDKQEVEVKLSNGEVLKGTIKWIDLQCIGIDGVGSESGTAWVLWLSSLAYVKHRN